MSKECHIHGACPFAFNALSEKIQNFGCLPTSHEVRNMRVNHGKTWACHETTNTPCKGAINWLKDEALPYKVIDKELLNEESEWHLYVS